MQKEITEEKALSLMAKDDSAGLRWFIQRYTPYVSTIVYNIIGEYMTSQDVEEVVSDVFCALWWNRRKAQPGKVRGYLACMARGHAINRLRGQGRMPMLDFDEIEFPVDGPEAIVIDEEKRQAIQETIDEMPATFKEIFVRYYFYRQSTSSIAQDMGLQTDAVRQRLRRGRIYLQNQFLERGIDDEN